MTLLDVKQLERERDQLVDRYVAIVRDDPLYRKPGTYEALSQLDEDVANIMARLEEWRTHA